MGFRPCQSAEVTSRADQPPNMTPRQTRKVGGAFCYPGSAPRGPDLAGVPEAHGPDVQLDGPPIWPALLGHGTRQPRPPGARLSLLGRRARVRTWTVEPGSYRLPSPVTGATSRRRAGTLLARNGFRWLVPPSAALGGILVLTCMDDSGLRCLWPPSAPENGLQNR